MRLADLIDISVLRTLADANFKASGMPVGIIDAVDGSVLVGVGWQDVCTMYHRVHAISAERCRESDDYIKAHLDEGKATEYRCNNGLRDIGIPIIVAGQHLATMFIGQFFYEGETPDRDFFVQQARQLGFDEAPYLDAVNRVPVFSRAAIENILVYDVALARFISSLAESALGRRETESRYSLLFHNMLEGFAYCRMLFDERGRPADFVYLDVNGAFGRLTGLHDVIGRRVSEVIPGVREAHPDLLEAYARVARTGEPERFEIEFQPLGKWLSISVYRPEPGHFVAVFDDVTTRRRAEEELRGAMQRLGSLLENSPLAVVEWSSVDFRISRWSDEAMRLFGWTGEEVVGKRIDELSLVHRDDWPLVRQAMTDMLSGRRPRNVSKNRNVRRDGAVIHCEWYNSTVSDTAGRLESVLSLVLDVTDRKRIEQELREADRAKDEFLSAASHELRTPLTTAILHAQGLARQLNSGPVDDERLRRKLASLGGQLDRLNRLVSTLLDVTRISSGHLVLEPQACDLAQLAGDALERFQADAERTGTSFVLDASPAIGAWDRLRLEQVLTNLLDNAIKYAPGATVEVCVATGPGGEDAVLTVRDSGPGIPPDSQARIFQQYERAAQARVFGGLGLGLWITRQIVEAHGGTISVESQPDAGSTFTVRLPREQR